MANFCSNCGSPITDEAKFCPNCGAALSESKPSTPVSQPSQTSAEAETNKEEKVYFDGIVHKTRCSIRSTNWYVGEDKIIPVTSVAAVCYAKYHPLYWGLAIIGVGIVGALLGSGGDGKVFIITFLIPLCMAILVIVFCPRGSIEIQTNSVVKHQIYCNEDEYPKCLNAMNECLQENR